MINNIWKYVINMPAKSKIIYNKEIMKYNKYGTLFVPN